MANLNNISAYGSEVVLIASITFPVGITISAFSDDADGVDVPSIQVSDKAMGVNGDLVTWSRAQPLNLTINVIPDSDDDINLGILLENNRVGRGKLIVQDVITLNVSYPTGKTVTFSTGVITDGMPATSFTSAGRFKTKPYSFTFQNRGIG